MIQRKKKKLINKPINTRMHVMCPVNVNENARTEILPKSSVCMVSTMSIIHLCIHNDAVIVVINYPFKRLIIALKRSTKYVRRSSVNMVHIIRNVEFQSGSCKRKCHTRANRSFEMKTVTVTAK